MPQQIQVGNRTVWFLCEGRGAGGWLLAWQEQGRTYWAWEWTSDSSVALQTLTPLVESLGTLSSGKPQPATVIVPGLGTNVHGIDASTPQGCGSEALHVYCEQLTARGQRVLVVPSAGTDRWLDVNDGRIDANAALLDRFVRQKIASGNLDPEPLLAGYSMGGVIARVAIARYHTPARGLVSFGAPYTGSYWADAYTTWMGASGNLDSFGFGLSVWDLTTSARNDDNKTLPSLSVSVRAIAGNAAVLGDGAVSISSACGKHARIGSDLRCITVRDFHPIHGESPNLQSDAKVADLVAQIASGILPPGDWKARSFALARAAGARLARNAASSSSRLVFKAPRRSPRIVREHAPGPGVCARAV